MRQLYFARYNAKLKRRKGFNLIIFSLPAGHACPFALLCQSRSDKNTGKITDGADTVFRCYATGAEALFPNIRKSRWTNFELIREAKTVKAMADLLELRIMTFRDVTHVRVHQSGDYFSQTYFDAWLEVAKRCPHIIFYGYTKALPFWTNRLDSIPSNFRLVASYGGKRDDLIATYGLRSARVVFSEAEAKKLGLPIDHDDSHVYDYHRDFAILLHGTQPKGSEAGKAWQKIKTRGKGGYKADYFIHYKKKAIAQQINDAIANRVKAAMDEEWHKSDTKKETVLC